MASTDSWVFHKGMLWAAELNTPEADPIAARIPAKFARLRPDTFPDLVGAARLMDPIEPEALLSRFEAGRECYAGRIEEEVAAYGWLTRGPEWVGEFERELNVIPGEAYIWNCATVPEHRRQRLFTALIGYVADQLRQEGLHRLWSISVINTPAMNRSVTQAGYTPILGMAYLRLFNNRYLFTRPAWAASAAQVAAGRRLLAGQTDTVKGSWIVGNTSRPMPPDTHYDG